MRYWVGKRRRDGKRETFGSEQKPTEQSHGDRYSVIEGPFASLAAAMHYTRVSNAAGGPPITQKMAEDFASKRAERAARPPWRRGDR